MSLHLTPPIVLLTALVVFAVIIASIFRLRKKSEDASDPCKLSYQAQTALLTPAELSFFHVLEQVVSRDYRLFAKVRLADIICPAGAEGRSQWRTAQNKIDRKQLDFVLCEAKAMVVIGVIELDDKSHQRPDRKARDSFLDDALAGASIPILHMPAQVSYSIEEIRQRLKVTFNFI